MKKKDTEEYVRLCPKCGSSNVEWRLGSSAVSIAVSGMGSAAVFDVFTCADCGYSSQLMPEFPSSKVDEVRRYIKSGSKHNTRDEKDG
ncbi:MAG: hypothetical protein NTU61_01750 [Candidatus Altiarchaeota archaeon]|nr:hypothetical protein [Candidatus Altiarchaeota archaeon]